MNDIIKIIEALENSGVLSKGATKAIENETKEQRLNLLKTRFTVTYSSINKYINTSIL